MQWTAEQNFPDGGADGVSPDERRQGSRITTIYRPVVIHVGDFCGFCLVRNISAGGLLGVVYADFATDQPIRVEFSETRHVEGTVVWAKDARIGVSFDSEIDVLKVLQDLGRKVIDNRINRAPRLAIETTANIEAGGITQRTAIHDISQRGVKIGNIGLSPSDEVYVEIEGLDAKRAVVRWTNGGMAGLNFVKPLEFDKLAGWVIDFQARRWEEQGRPV